MECIFNWRDYCRPDTDFKYAAKEITIRAAVVLECRHVINREKEENTILPFLRKRIQDEGPQSSSFFIFSLVYFPVWASSGLLICPDLVLLYRLD